MRIFPFKALSPVPERAAQVAAPPYDVVSTAEARLIAAGNPACFLHVTRPEIDLADTVNPASDEVYARGRAALEQLRSGGVLRQEAEPCLYLYRLTMGGHVQRGITACLDVEDYARQTIRTHEKTRRDKEDDRTRHTMILRANAGPVFILYRHRAEIDRLVADIERGAPLYDFAAPDGVRHAAWRIADTERVAEAFRAVDVCYIADGHHRAAAAVRAAADLKAANPAHTGREEYTRFLGVLFPDNQLQILPYNRCVRDLNGLSKEAFLTAVGERFSLREHAAPAPAAPGHAAMYLAGRWYGLQWEAAAGADPVSTLDVSILQDRLLAPVLGIDDPRTSGRIEFVGGIRGPDELARAVDAGRAAVAFSMYPTTVGQLMDIADAGQTMPPKSTWFEPKLRSGLFVHLF